MESADMVGHNCQTLCPEKCDFYQCHWSFFPLSLFVDLNLYPSEGDGTWQDWIHDYLRCFVQFSVEHCMRHCPLHLQH
ncbi:hypothetical protein XELAEV_18003830mg [Xenopus laevis]|uniref:Uncharacterized protein n=1 Tax=Xenopus laevis TaxID=8355 RepID=A0A974BMY8_XENLA|nr:hypothetical protein XELAEV_18003830mg [Xenopus laevis]